KYNEIISPWDEKIGWRVNGPGLFKMDIIYDGNKNALLLSMRKEGFQILEPFETELISPLVFWDSKNYGSLKFEIGIKKIKVKFYSDLEHVTFFLEEQAVSISSPLKTTLRDAAAVDEKSFAAPMPAKIVSVNVHNGSEVTAGTVLIILEAMKIEHPIRTTVSGVVETVFFAEGDIVEEGEQLLKFKPDGTN
ncbi:MAG: biotin/lipoyl-containing protein, partial [Pseudomonadota bacterium]|nr:biotin/lipoyl-containing protein [Pseudomonadota bacterium]